MINLSIIQKSQLEGANRIDAEYYQPEYLELVNKILWTKSYKAWKDIDGKFITGPFGSEFNVENYVTDTRNRYVRGKDVKKLFLDDSDNVYIPEKDFERLKKYSLHNGDILVTVVGTLGNSVIVDNSVLPAIFSCKSTAFRTNAINPFYFIAYLNSKYGHDLLVRSVRGHVQTGLNIDDLKSLLVFIPTIEKQETIASTVIQSKKLMEDSKKFYLGAEGLLLDELGLRDFKFQEDLTYVVNLSDVEQASRGDADYFQPKYNKLIPRIKEQNAKTLGELVSIKKGFEPGSEQYQGEGKLFVRVSSLSKFGIDSIDQKYLSEDFYQELKKDFQPQGGEILLTKDATPGIAYVLKEPIEGIISGGILRLKLREEINGEYLALCMNSIVGQMQAERDAGGSVIAHWRPEQIKKLLIPILPKSTQEKIAELVRKSHEARKKAKELLGEAKRKIEEMIEKGGE